MAIQVTITKVRPNTSIDFKNKNLPLNKPTWPGYIEQYSSTNISVDGLTEVAVTRWESLDNYLNPVLTEFQKVINDACDLWNKDNNLQVTISYLEEN
jgi:hypothetical protein